MTDHLSPAPLNALGPPRGPGAAKEYQGRRLVLVRLVWRSFTEVRPGVAVWAEAGRVCVEWEPRRGTKRLTWVAQDDVRPRLRYSD